MKREWLLKLYEKEIKKIGLKSKEIGRVLGEEDSDGRIRDYRIYQECVKTAYVNDIVNNRDKKVTYDEQSILNTLVEQLELSHEEVKLINYTVIPLEKYEIDEVINYLVKCGIVLYSKKNHQIYVPDEVIQILRRIRKREVSDKVFRRVLKQLKDSQVNLIARRHNIDRKLSIDEKIKEIIKEGIGFTTVMLKSAHKEETTKTEKKEFLNYLIDKKLKIEDHIRGASLEDKFANLVEYFNKKDQEDNISISIHGYDKLLVDLKETVAGFEKFVRQEFELQETTPVDAKTLSLYNLKPIDILYLLEDEQIKEFCTTNGVSTRGNEVQNILENYKDVQNLYLENYVSISFRDLNGLKANNIDIKEGELGIQFEELTKLIFKKMNLNVDEKLAKSINNAKNKVDVVVNLGSQEIIIFECKSKKDRSLRNYSSVSRQVKAYKELAEGQGCKVVKSFIVAPEFSNDFVNECGLDYELNLSLITSTDLLTIYEAYRASKMDDFPYKILLRDVLIDSGRVIMALNK